jgi:hypothetical protein
MDHLTLREQRLFLLIKLFHREKSGKEISFPESVFASPDPASDDMSTRNNCL